MHKIGIFVIAAVLSVACKNSGSDANNDTVQRENTEKQEEVKAPDIHKVIIDSLSGVLDKNPKDIASLVARGNAYLDAKNPAYARADADAAYYLDSTKANVLLLRGDVYYVLNKTRISRDMWERCSNQFPKDKDCRLRMAELYLAVKDLESALKRVNEVLEIEPKEATALFMKGVCIRDLYADTALAMQYFQRAIDMRDGDYIEALDMMGVMLSHKRDPMAISYFKNALALDPNRADLYHKIGLSYTYEDEYNAALEAYEKSLQLNPRNDEVYFNIGFIHITLHNYDLAIDNFNKSLAIREMNVKALYGRGFAYEMRGDVMNAAKDYKSCLGMYPDYNPAKVALQRIDRMMKEDNIGPDNQ